MYSFASGTIVSARTSSPSMPGTQPVSSNISLAVSRRALTSLVVALLMIGFLVLVHRPTRLAARRATAAEQRDERAAFHHSITSSSRTAASGLLVPIAFAESAGPEQRQRAAVRRRTRAWCLYMIGSPSSAILP